MRPAFTSLSTRAAAILLLCLSCASGLRETRPASPPLVWPAPPASPRIEYVRAIRGPEDIGVKKFWLRRLWEFIAGSGAPFALEQPYAVYADDAGRIFVTDTKEAAVDLLDPQGRTFRTWTKAGAENIVSPVGIAGDTQGRIYVSDSVLNRIFVFSTTGDLIAVWGDDAGLERPVGLAVGGDGSLFVADTYHHRIVVLKDGRMMRTLGSRGTGAGQFNFPTHLCVRDGKLYVTDAMNFRVQIFRETGEFLSEFGKNGDGAGDLPRPKGISVDSEGHVYVVDGLYDVVQVFDERGTFLLSFGGTGHGRGDLWLPGGLAAGPQDVLYVADSYNGRLQVFRYLTEGPRT